MQSFPTGRGKESRVSDFNKMRYLIGRYHEIALKGRNQWRFVDQLKQNLRDIFADYRLAICAA